MEELHDSGSIEPRSRHDRAAIGELQWRNHLQTIGSRSTGDQDDDYGPIAAQSWPDRGAIVARSRPDRGPIVPKIVAFSKQNSSLFAVDLKPQSHAIETAFTTLENRPHGRINCPRSSGQFPSLKSCISLLCSSTFDRLVKKLSEFRGRS